MFSPKTIVKFKQILSPVYYIFHSINLILKEIDEFQSDRIIVPFDDVVELNNAMNHLVRLLRSFTFRTIGFEIKIKGFDFEDFVLINKILSKAFEFQNPIGSLKGPYYIIQRSEIVFVIERYQFLLDKLQDIIPKEYWT